MHRGEAVVSEILDTKINEPLRVLVVVTSMNRGGLETFTMNVYRALNRSKVQLDFLLHRSDSGAYEEEIESLGGHIYRVRRQNPLDPRYWTALNEFFAKHPYEVVWAQLDCLSAEPLAAAARHGAIVRVAHSHNSYQDRDLKYPLKMLCKPLIKRYATDLFACGEEAGRWMFNTDDFEVVRNCILNMWDELDRMYAARPVVLPLLGSGITRFDGGKPSEDDLLRCMLCTLRASKRHFKEGVVVVLTEKTAARMRLYEVNGYIEAWENRIGEKDGL